MPELPEVETTVRGLNKRVKNLAIKEVFSDWPKMIRDISFSQFQKNVRSKKIIGATRRAKNILISLDSGDTILIHMKMTGHLMYGTYKKIDGTWSPQEKGALADPYNRFIHFIINFTNGKSLAFSDARKFGKITLIKKDHLKHSSHLAHLGPEPLHKNFTEKKFTERVLKKPQGKIKQVLLDQTIIAGIGNIYSDEMLFRAGIHPTRKPKTLSKKEWHLLYESMKKVLTLGIEFGGDSTSDYRNIDGERGKFHETHMVYRETGKPCKKKGCKGVIIRLLVGGRSAHFCNSHQK